MDTMFIEWCEETYNSGRNVMSSFRAILHGNDFTMANLPDIDRRAKYIYSKYGR